MCCRTSGSFMAQDDGTTFETHRMLEGWMGFLWRTAGKAGLWLLPQIFAHDRDDANNVVTYAPTFRKAAP